MLGMNKFRLMSFPEFRDKAVTLSYDDGARSDERLIKIMRKFGLKGTFNLNSGFLENENNIHASEIRELYIESGNEVAVHGVEHLHLTRISEVSLIEEILGDRKSLEKITDKIITGMAYAYGAYDDRVISVIKRCGIKYARITGDTEAFGVSDDWFRWAATCHHNNPKLFALVDSFLTDATYSSVWSNPLKLFYLWGHSYEFIKNDNWDRIERFAEKIGNRADVWYATNGEIVDYIEAYKSLIYSADGKTVYNPTLLDVYLRGIDDKKVMIPKGKTVKLK